MGDAGGGSAGSVGEGAPNNKFVRTMEALKEDALLSEYLRPDFGLDRLVSEALSRPAADTSARCEGLERGIAMLDVAIKDEVVRRRGPLLSHVEGLAMAEQRVSKVRAQIETLKRGLAGPRADLDSHRRTAQRLVAKMAVLRETTDLARMAGRLSRWAGRLRSELKDTDWAAVDAAASASARPEGREGGAADVGSAGGAGYGGLPLAATLVRDFQAELALDPRVRRLTFIADHARFVDETGSRLSNAADTLLSMGTANDRPAETAVALQIFYNLGKMKVTVEKLLEGYRGFVRNTLREALAEANDVKAAQGAGGGSSGGGSDGAAAWKERYWEGMRGCATRLAGIVVRVWHLQRVLQRKRDPSTYQPFLELVTDPGKPLPARAFVGAVLDMVDEELDHVRSAGGAARDLLRDQYPYLVNFLLSILSKSEEATESIKGVPPFYQPEYKERLIAAAKPFVDLHLGDLRAKAPAQVAKYFAAAGLPSSGVGDKGSSASRRPVGSVAPLVRMFEEELEALGSSHLAEDSVIQGFKLVAGALGFFVEKVSLHLVSSGRDVARIEKPTPAQLCNIALCVQCLELEWRMQDVLKKWGEDSLPKFAVTAIEEQLELLRAKAGECAEPMLMALAKGAEEKVAKMHAEFSGSRPSAVGTADVAPSDYMVGLVALLKLFSAEYLNRFPFIAQRTQPAGTGTTASPPGKSVVVLTRKLKSTASRVLDVYVRHACLASPWSERVAQTVGRDAEELEKAVTSHIWPCKLLGENYLTFRGFKLLTSVATSRLPDLPTADLVRDTKLTPSDAAHHLLARCASLDAGRTQLPHSRRSLTPLQYALWLDGRDAAEVWKGIGQAIDAVAEPGDEVTKLLAIVRSFRSA